ncbi:hypothetical protein WKH56_08435 [Priestia sp. SB1]|uniref:hypothetical protein n=1 Tax=Priestia sp. SB1 TaxID=3132359 RepID=UPI003181A24D
MYSIVSSKDGAENYKSLFTEALGEITKELKLFQGEELNFTASKEIKNPSNFKLMAPVSLDPLKWMGYAAENMHFWISVDMVSNQREIVYKPALKFYKLNGDIITLDVSSYANTDVEFVYDRINMSYTCRFKHHKLIKHLEIIEYYATKCIKNVSFSVGIDMLTKKANKYEDEDKMVIATCLKGIINTINEHLSVKTLTAEDKRIQTLTNELKDIMLEMEC